MKTGEFYAFTAQIKEPQAFEKPSKSARLPLISLLIVLFAGCGFFWKEISAAQSELSSVEKFFLPESAEVVEQRNPIYDLVISPFGETLLYRDHHGKVYQQELVTSQDRRGSVIDLFPGMSCEGMKMSPVGNTLAVTFSTGEVCLKKLDTSGDPIILLGESDRITESLAFSPDGNLLAAGMTNGSVIVWDTQSLETVGVIRGKNTTAFCVLFDTPTSLLISFDNGLEHWRFREPNGSRKRWRRSKSWRIDQSVAREMEVTSDGHYLLAASFDGKVTCWDLSTQERFWEQKLSLPCARSLQISRDEKTFVCHGDTDTITVRDLNTGEPIIWLTDPDMGTGTGARFSMDGNLLYSSSSDGLIRFWTIPGESLIGTVVTSSP
jgi:WD40 repeat protein